MYYLLQGSSPQDSIMAKKKKRLAAIKKKDDSNAAGNGFGMAINEAELGMSPAQSGMGKAIFKRGQGKMSPLMNAEKTKFMGIRKK